MEKYPNNDKEERYIRNFNYNKLTNSDLIHILKITWWKMSNEVIIEHILNGERDLFSNVVRMIIYAICKFSFGADTIGAENIYRVYRFLKTKAYVRVKTKPNISI